MLKIVERRARAAYKIIDKQKRYAAVDAVKAKVKAAFAPAEGEDAKYTSEQIGAVFKELQAKVVRWNILDTGIAHRWPRPEHGSPDRLAKSAFCRAPTVRRCSPAAKPRRWSLPRSAPARTSSMSIR